jgi:hypothetical protein
MTKAANLHYAIVQKLNPINFPKMPGVMAAVVGFVLDVTFIEPRILAITITPDGFVLAKAEGDAGATEYLGRYTDLLRGWSHLISIAKLTLHERIEAESLFATRIGYLGWVSA